MRCRRAYVDASHTHVAVDGHSTRASSFTAGGRGGVGLRSRGMHFPANDTTAIALRPKG